ncbi:sensor domain-containing diguanylate cyclase [Desulfotalea psychrophila]|uniref:Uncharacterized protein n=1 Tax=Desulfotalea psychrophila (strain LSv54 / DSM 12343) TaxID=177439 RepID=Q6AJ00_DESPS|nr:diguanylate cyclase [Desulfotalea psychrophila]CAG37680.1 hypothetical protein DP2951 [Desulfotalea psychrophila LSv54]
MTCKKEFSLEKISSPGLKVGEKELKAPEANLQKNRLSLLQEAAFEPMAIFDKERKCLEANDILLDVFGYSAEETIGANLHKLFAPRPEGELEHKTIGRFFDSYEATMLRRDGSKFPALVQEKELRYQGETVQVIKFHDISKSKGIQERLKFALAELDTIFTNSMVGIALIDASRIIRRANPRFSETLGYGNPQNIVGMDIKELYFCEKEFEAFGIHYITTLKENGIVHTDAKFKCKNSSPIWARVVGKAIDQNDLNRGIIWIAEDITEQRTTQKELQLAYNELEAIFNNSLVGILLLGQNRKIHRVNKRLATILGYDEPLELLGKGVEKIHLSEKNFKEFGEKHYNSLKQRDVFQIDYQLKRKDGSPAWVTLSGQALDSADPPDLDKGVLWMMDDATKRKKAEEKLVRIAATDSLTKLNNRRHFFSLGHEELALHLHNAQPLSVLMLDIDHFKNVNDTLGHQAGDKVLKIFSKICAVNLRSVDIIGRIGGEEFAVILTNTPRSQAQRTAERIRLAIETSPEFTKQSLPKITVSIGIATNQPPENLDAIICRADKNLYQAKSNGRNRIEPNP